MKPFLQALGPPAPLHLFSTWEKTAGIPEVAAGVYTVWIRDDQPPELPYPAQPFVYAGYSGRSLTAAAIEAKRAAGEKRKGLRNRLYCHATGRRSGDQFAVYVADRFVLPTLSAKDIADIAQGRVGMDEYVRAFVTKRLARPRSRSSGCSCKASGSTVRRCSTRRGDG